MAKSAPPAPLPAGTNPYPAVDPLSPAPLTANSANVLRDQLKFIEGERVRLAGQRAEFLRQVELLRAEVDGIDTVLAELDGTANRYRQRLGGADAVVWPASGQGDATAHAAMWTGGVPETGVFAPVPQEGPFGELDESKAAALDGFLGSHSAIGQDGTR